MPLLEVSVILEILVPPVVPKLYFWALQVDFVEGGRRLGGAHTGLQWNQRYPGGRAVNWGGYRVREEGGGILPGSDSALPGFDDDPHTRSYGWRMRRPYMLRVYRTPGHAGSWRAEVTDVGSGAATIIRDLHPGGGHLASPVVWSEVFADCDAPSVTVRWSQLRTLDARGTVVTPEAVRLSYQDYAAGGCTNTSTTVEDASVLQVTNAMRAAPHGALLRLR